MDRLHVSKIRFSYKCINRYKDMYVKSNTSIIDRAMNNSSELDFTRGSLLSFIKKKIGFIDCPKLFLKIDWQNKNNKTVLN